MMLTTDKTMEHNTQTQITPERIITILFLPFALFSIWSAWYLWKVNSAFWNIEIAE